MATFGNLFHTDSVAAAVEHAQYLEQETTFSRLWMGDTHQLWANCYVSLTACAAATEEIEVGTAVTNPVTRHPTVTANAIASLNQFSGGRANLGIGAGDSAVFSIGNTPATMAYFFESTRDIQALLSGESITVDGEPFELGFDTATPEVNVYVASMGPKSLQIAGEIGDHVMIGCGGDPSFVEEYAIANVSKGLERAGRSLDEIELSMLLTACAMDTKEEAIDRVKYMTEPQGAITYRSTMEGVPDELRQQVEEMVERHDMSEHVKTDAKLPDQLSSELLDFLENRHAVAGTPEQCRERLLALEAAGIDEFVLHFDYAPDRTPFIERFDREVLRPLAAE